MNIDLKKLKCSREELKSYIWIVRKLQPSTVWIQSMSHTLTLFAERTEDKHGNPLSSEDFVVVRIPYLGAEFDFKQIILKELAATDLDAVKSIKLQHEDAKVVPLSAHKKQQKVLLEADILKEALTYMLPASPCKNEEYDGIRFDKGEVSSTDGSSIHYWLMLPPLTQGAALMGTRTAHTLLKAISALEPFDVRALYLPGKKAYGWGEFHFEMSVEDVEVRINSFPRLVPGDGPDQIRHPPAVGVKVDHSFLESVCKYAIKTCKEKEAPILEVALSDMFHYTVGHLSKKNSSRSGSLRMERTYGEETPITFRVDAHRLLQAIKGLGDTVQIISPWHPIDGLKYYQFNPIYVSGTKGDRFAVVSLVKDSNEWRQIGLERAQAEDALRSAVQTT